MREPKGSGTKGRTPATFRDYVSSARHVELIDWPGFKGRQLGLMLLHCGEIQEAHFEARRHFAKQGIEPKLVSEGYFALEEQYQLISAMWLRPDSKDPKDRIFRDASQVRKYLTPDHVAWCLERHRMIQTTEVSLWETGLEPLPQIALALGFEADATVPEILAAIEELQE